MRLSIVVMAYNEAPSIVSVLEEIDATLAREGYPYEVIVVNDGSTDGTGEAAVRYGRSRPHVLTLHHEVNRGIGEVYRSGFGAARGELVTFLPADGQFPADIVKRFVPLMARADLVVSRFDPHRRTLTARTLSMCERLLYRVLFGRLPEFRGIMMFRRSLLAEMGIQPGGRGWGVLMEILVRSARAGLHIESMHITLRPRAAGVSKVNNMKSVVANVRQALELRRTLHRAPRHHEARRALAH
jgi:dolichol-phosphate mannosyltransferase